MRYITRVFSLLILMICCSCQKELQKPIVFNIDVSEVSAFYATVTITHNATNRSPYYYFTVKGSVDDVDAAIDEYLSSVDQAELTESANYQRKKVVRVTGLAPQEIVTIIVFGLDAGGQKYGQPMSVTFNTLEREYSAKENANWSIEYQGHKVYNYIDYSLISVDVDDDVKERFFLVVYPVEFVSKFENIESLIDYSVYEFLNDLV